MVETQTLNIITTRKELCHVGGADGRHTIELVVHYRSVAFQAIVVDLIRRHDVAVADVLEVLFVGGESTINAAVR